MEVKKMEIHEITPFFFARHETYSQIADFGKRRNMKQCN